MKDLRVELKICEGCGALWLRTVSEGNYCRSCSRWVSDCPAPRGHFPKRAKQHGANQDGRKQSDLDAAVSLGGAR